MARYSFDLPLGAGGAYWAGGFNQGRLLVAAPAEVSETKLVWSWNFGGKIETFTVTGTGFVVQQSGNLIVDVTAGHLTGISDKLVDTTGVVFDVSMTRLNSDAAHFFDLVQAADWTGLFGYMMRGNDQIIGSRNADVLEGGSGKDQIFGSGGNDNLIGGFGDDRLSGGYGADTLVGGVGTDTLIGGVGHDVLTGSGGHDQFLFNTAVNAANSDVITDFTPGTDHIALSSKVFAGLGALGQLDASHFADGLPTTAEQVIVYDRASGWVSYDPDGSGAAAAIALVQVHTGLDVTASDFLVL
ncbi:hypothetical protein GC209_00020 [bacterium]|nr:hypothetical protein [bacterium]